MEVNKILTNVKNAYGTEPDGKVKQLSLAVLTGQETTELQNPIDATVSTACLAILEGCQEKNKANFKVGYNLWKLMESDCIEKTGYANIKVFAEQVFDIAGSTAYMYANICRQMVEYDPDTNLYKSKLAVEYNGMTYDFSMSQLQEMIIPDRYKEKYSLDIWKQLIDKRILTTSTKTQGVRFIRSCIEALVDSGVTGEKLTTDEVKALMEKSETLGMKPAKALTTVIIDGQSGQAEGQSGQAEGQSGQSGQAEGQSGQAEGQSGQSGQAEGQSGQSGQAEGQSGQSGQKSYTERIYESIDTFISDGSIGVKVSDLVGKVHAYLEYAKLFNSDIVAHALRQTLTPLFNTYADILTKEEQPTEEQPTEVEQKVDELTDIAGQLNDALNRYSKALEEQPTEEQPTEEQPTEEQPTEEQPTEEQPTEPTEPTGRKSGRKTGRKTGRKSGK